MKDWVIAWGSGVGTDVKTYDVATYQDGLDRLDAINAPKRVLQSDGTFKSVFPVVRWSVIARNNLRTRREMGIANNA